MDLTRRHPSGVFAGLALALGLACVTAVTAQSKDIVLTPRPEATPAPDTAGDPLGAGSRRALVIGISRYQDVELELGTPAHDAASVSRFLEDAARTGGHEVRLLMDAGATRAAIAGALLALKDAAGPRDAILFYYSGHAFLDGSGEAYLFPVDGRRRILEDTGYPFRRILEMLVSIQARQKIVILDCCHSGALGESLVAGARGGEDRRVSSEALDRLLEGTGLVVLSSSRGDQLSWESPARGGGADASDGGDGDGAGLGLFTRYLLEGLAGEADGDWGEGRGNRDGYVELQELLEFVYYRANAAALAAFGRPQQATLSGQIGAPIYLSRVPGLAGRRPSGDAGHAKAVLLVDSDPPGARIVIGGSDVRRRTPARFDLAAGLYEIALEADPALSWNGRVRLGAGAFESFRARLHPAPSAIAPGPEAPPDEVHRQARELLAQGRTKDALAQLEQAAGRGHAPSHDLLGTLFERGGRLAADPSRAAGHYRQAAESGLARSQYMFGIMQIEGRGIPADREAGLAWIRRSAGGGHLPAQRWLTDRGQGW